MQQTDLIMKDYPDASSTSAAVSNDTPADIAYDKPSAIDNHTPVASVPDSSRNSASTGYLSMGSSGSSEDTVSSSREKSPQSMSAHSSATDSTPLSSMENTPSLPSSEYSGLGLNQLSADTQAAQPFIGNVLFDYNSKQRNNEHEVNTQPAIKHEVSTHLVTRELPNSCQTSQNVNQVNSKEAQIDTPHILNFSESKEKDPSTSTKDIEMKKIKLENQSNFDLSFSINTNQETKEYASPNPLPFLRRSTRIRKPTTFKMEYLNELTSSTKPSAKTEAGNLSVKLKSNADQSIKINSKSSKGGETAKKSSSNLSNKGAEVSHSQQKVNTHTQSTPSVKKKTVKLSELCMKKEEPTKSSQSVAPDLKAKNKNTKKKKKKSIKLEEFQMLALQSDPETDLSDLDEDCVTSKWKRMVKYGHFKPFSATEISKIQKQKKKVPQFDDSERPKKRRRSYNVDEFEEELVEDINEFKKLKTEKSIKQKSTHLEKLTRAFDERFELYEQLTNKCKTLHNEIKIMEKVLFRNAAIPLINQIKDFKFQMNTTEWKIFENIIQFFDTYKPVSSSMIDQKSSNEVMIDDDDSIPMTDIFDLKKIPRNNDSCKFINASSFIAGFKQHYTQFPECVSGKNEVESIRLFNPFLFGLSETYPLLIPKDDEYNPMFELGRTMAITATTFFPEHLRMQIINYNQPNFSVVGSFAIGLANNDLPLIKSSVNSYNFIVSSSIKEIRSYVLKKFKMKKKKPLDENKSQFHQSGRCFIKEILQQVYIRCIPANINALRQYKAFSNNVYGEILPTLLSRMLKECNARPNDIFLDLGSGVGNCVLQASLEFKCDSYGIEIMKGPSELCETQFEEFKNRVNYYGLRYGAINFYLQESFLDNKKMLDLIPKVDIILVNNYVFDSMLNIKVGLLLNALKPGAKIIHMKPIDGLGDKNSISSRLKCYEVPFANGMVSWTHNNGKFFIGEVQKTYLKDAFDVRLQTRSRSKKFSV